MIAGGLHKETDSRVHPSIFTNIKGQSEPETSIGFQK